MAQPLTSFPRFFGTDIELDGGDFSSTTATLTPVSDAGREFFSSQFGSYATSVEMPKSEAIRFADFAADHQVMVG